MSQPAILGTSLGPCPVCRREVLVADHPIPDDATGKWFHSACYALRTPARTVRVAPILTMLLLLLTLPAFGEPPSFTCRADGRLITCLAAHTGDASFLWAALPAKGPGFYAFGHRSNPMFVVPIGKGVLRLELRFPEECDIPPLVAYAKWRKSPERKCKEYAVLFSTDRQALMKPCA